MIRRISVFFFVLSLCLPFVFITSTQAQQTLGGITGTVTDTSGALVTDATVTAVNDQTTLTRTLMTSAEGAYTFVNLPIGTYTLTFEHSGFESQKIPSILVQANRTATVNAQLKVGQVTQTVTVEETPLLNAVDTTNGYVLDKSQVESIPLPTGSFTGIAILSAGVNSELSSGTGVNQGLGNNPIWANGQRDTSNTFLLNGVDASNLFNGKSTSSVASARIVNNTGVAGAGSTTAEAIQSTASPYLAIGQALPTPAPETIQEVRVNTSMYDAQQGSTSGAHIDLSTASGTNEIHGQLYGHRGTNWINAAPFFYNQDPNIPPADKVPGLHRYDAGGTLGGPLIKNKLFAFVSYQHVHTSDLEIGTSRTAVPYFLTDDRSPAGLAAAVEQTTGTCPTTPPTPAPCPYFAGGAVTPTIGTGGGQIDPIAYTLLNYKLPNGQFLIPSANPAFTPTINFPENIFVTDPAYFIADQAVGDLDFIATSKDTLAFKYYYQHDPTTAPFGYSSFDGFTQKLDAGSQVATITNTQTLTPAFNVDEVFGFIREKVFSTIGQPFTPGQLASACETATANAGYTIPLADCTINTFGSTNFPGMTIVDDFGNPSDNTTYNTNYVYNAAATIGATGASQGAFTGVFQNRWMPSADAVWIHGKHTITFGGSFSYTQLDTRDERTNKGMIGFTDFSNFLQGLPVTYSADGFITSTFLNGNADRYYRSKETGLYVQDKFQIAPSLSLSLGLRWDDHGGLSEKDGELYNFNPALYDYDPTTDTIISNGFIVAGNNSLFPSKGVSSSTLTGRQWGLSPRIGIAWSPKKFDSKVVVRAGWGLYYDRGELFTYLSPGFAAGVVAGGPFGVNQSPPYVNSTLCSPYAYTPCSFQNPWGTTPPVTPTGNPADLFLPNAGDIETGIPLFSFAVYNRANKLPYTMNETLNVQWQPRNDLAIDIGYVGNLGRHEIVPIPFNQARIASPSNPLCGPAPVCASPGTSPFAQQYTYGYSIVTENTAYPYPSIDLPDGTPYQQTFEGGNVDLRVPVAWGREKASGSDDSVE